MIVIPEGNLHLSSSSSNTAKPHWSAIRSWQTNAALLIFGFGLINVTRQLIVEYDTVHNYRFGFDGVAGSSLALYFGAIFLFALRPANINRYTFPIILGVAIACRLVALLPDPALSSDVYRYAWDGVVQHAGINPFRYVPGDPALTALRAPNQDLFDNMNRRDYAHTIYPPVAQMVFYLITWINPSVTMMKLGMVLFEGLTLLGLVKLLKHLGRPREWAIIYAWCPLLIWEFGGSGHLDSIAMAFITFALLFRYRRRPVLTGLAVFTKFYPIVLFPALYQRRPDGKLDWKMPATLAACALCYLPYLSVGKGVFGFFGGYVDEEGIQTGERFYLLDQLKRIPGLHSLPHATILVLVLAVFGALTVWAWRTSCRPDSAPAAFLPKSLAFAFALMLLFSPHYPWYVAWLVPFLVLMPNLPVFAYVSGLFYLCTTALAVGAGPKQFHLNQILYSTVLIATLAELALRCYPSVRAWLRSTSPYTGKVL